MLPHRTPSLHTWARVRRLAAALILVASPALAADDDSKDPRDKDKAGKPRLSLRASPPVAFSPARIVVTAELTGGDPAELYCADVEWEWGDETKSEAKQNCEPYEEGVSTVTRRWTQSHTFTRMGRHTVFLRLKRGGKVLTAGSVKVDVRPGAGDLSDFDR